MRDYQCADLFDLLTEPFLHEKKRRTSIPIRANTVSLLASLAFKSPRSPLPVIGVAKWRPIAALEPPAATPHKDRSDALKHRAGTRRDGRPCLEAATKTGVSVSKTIALSFRMSARNR